MDRKADDQANRRATSGAVVRTVGWALLICAALAGGWIVVQDGLPALVWDRPSERDVINAAREFVEMVDPSQIARPGRWQTEWEGVTTTPPPSDPTYRVRPLSRGRWEVQGIAIVGDSYGERRLRWTVLLSRERGDWYCQRAGIGAIDESTDE